MQAHFYHPFIVHFAVVLPFVILFLLFLNQEKYLLKAVMLLSIALLFFSIASFYTGSWVGAVLAPDLEQEARAVFDRHALLGRIYPWLSALLLVLVLANFFGKKYQKITFIFIKVIAALLCLIALLSGYSGGVLVHEF
jgi:uncharacterized membrane protein